MEPPRHRATTAEPMITPAALRLNALCLVLVNVGTGVTYLIVALSNRSIGASAPTLVLVQALMPLWVWALALTAAGILIAAKQYVPGHTIALLVWGYWTGCALTALVLGTTTGAGGVFLLLQLTLQHLIALTWRRQVGRPALKG